MQIIQKLISFLYPLKIQQNKGIKSILIVDILILFFSFVSSVIFLYVEFNQGAIITGYAFLASIFFLILPNFIQNLNYLGIYFTFQTLVVCFSLMYFTGGIASPFQFLIFCICPVSFTFFKKEIATKHSILTIVCYLSFAIVQLSGIDFKQNMSEIQVTVAWICSFLFTTMLFIYAIRNFHAGLKKKNVEIQSSNEKLLKTNEELERFAYIASHDLKSPIRNILSFINLIDKKYSKQLDEKGNEFIQIISTNAEQMHHLVEDILEYSKSSNRKAKKERVDLNKVLDQVTNQILNDYKYSECQIICPIELPIIVSDFTLLKQVFQNLIENGLKYNDSFKKVVSIQFLEKRLEYYFMVKDNGIGIDEEYTGQIFEMFKRLHSKNEYHGTGIGLSVCKNFLNNMGGKIWVTSKPGDGSIFHISLPKNSLKDFTIEQNPEVKESFQLN